jgi:redox-sensitive bicupin YhaK (pirin superfamily)
MISAEGDATVFLIGGEPLGRRHLYWNFVSSRKERIVQAADDWAARRFPDVPGDSEFIPLPERRIV